MLKRSTKEYFYSFAGPLMRINAKIYKLFHSAKNQKKNKIKLHLGPGQKKYIPGWINIDGNMFTAKCDVWADLRYPLPFHDSTIDGIYSHHMIEHLPDLAAYFKDVYRCLKPGASYRVGGPNGDGAIKKFIDGDSEWFGDWPDKRKTIGGRFENFIFCRQEHLTILTFSFLEELLLDAGFVNIHQYMPTKETSKFHLFQDCLKYEEESDFDTPHTLIIESDKPFNR